MRISNAERTQNGFKIAADLSPARPIVCLSQFHIFVWAQFTELTKFDTWFANCPAADTGEAFMFCATAIARQMHRTYG